MAAEIQIRECVTLDELSECVALQREVFGLPDIEISPVRHLIVSRSAGGFILGAFAGNELVGFVLSVPAFLRDTRGLLLPHDGGQKIVSGLRHWGKPEMGAARRGSVARREIH
jgi:predicted GNAT superfamily acetyltransferase